MAQTFYRGNLSSRAFPLSSRNFSRTVIIAGADQVNTPRQAQPGSEEFDDDRGIPQAYYMHNVMPSAEGFQSISYETRAFSGVDGFSNVFYLLDILDNRVLFSHHDDGRNFVLLAGTTTWLETTNLPATVGSMVTTATLQGQTYIYFYGVGCYMYNVATNTLVPIVLTGITLNTTRGITNSSGYMIVWSANSIAWSSTVPRALSTDPIDFVPSLITGAGGGQVESARGSITLCVTHYLGVIIYTEDNAVAAVFSGNATYPFNFRVIVGAGGIADQTLISAEAAGGNHYAYTTVGLQLVGISQATAVYPEVTDFISARYFEDFNENSNLIESTYLNNPMVKRLNFIADRYLAISYGVQSLTHTLVYDIRYKRLGKLKTPHVYCFEFKYRVSELGDTARRSIGFIDFNGAIKSVNFTLSDVTRNGVIILGKFQLTRARLTTLDEVTFESVFPRDFATAGTFNVYDCISLDGKNLLAPVLGYVSQAAGGTVTYSFRGTGINHSLICVGAFELQTFVLKLHVSGSR